MYSSALIAGACALFASHVSAQAGPNTLAKYNPTLRTQSANQTTFIVPVDKSAVQAAVPLFKLLPVPTNDKTLFPKGFPAGKHPLIVSTSYDGDIRQFSLEIDSLMSGQVYVPFVDRLSDGATPFNYELVNYIGGTNGQLNMALVPAIVGSAEGTTIYVATFMPDTAAYKDLGNGQFSSQVKQVIIPNPVSGPGVVPSAIDALFSTAAANQQIYTAHTFHALLNQPLILSNGLCQRNAQYFNASFAEPIFRTGSVTLYAGSIPASVAGTYNNLGGYSANAENLGENPQECKAAAQSVDPAATQ